MLLLPAVLLIAASNPAPLRIEIAATMTEVLAGEPVKLVVRWTVVKPMSVFVEDGEFVGETRFVVGEGQDERIYREYPRSLTERILAPQSLSPGDDVVTGFVLAYGFFEDDPSTVRLLFDHPGRYALRLRYRERPGTPPVDSNTVRLLALPPPPQEAELFETLKGDPEILSLAKARHLGVLDRHPDSRYLRWTTLTLEEYRYARFVNGRDPDTGESFLALPERERRERGQLLARKLRDRLLTAGPWGSLEEDRLRLARRFATNAGDREAEGRIEEEILNRFPSSVAAFEVRRSKAARKEETERLQVREKPRGHE